MGAMVWRVLGIGSKLLAGIAATKAVDLIWRKAGQDNRIDPKNPQVPARQALAYAALTGLAAGAAKTMATRKAAAYYEHSAGHLPKAMLKDEQKVARSKG